MMDIVISEGKHRLNDMSIDVLVVGEVLNISGYKEHSAGFNVQVTDRLFHGFYYDYSDDFLIFNIKNHAERTIIGQKLLKYTDTNLDKKLILFHSDIREIIEAIE